MAYRIFLTEDLASTANAAELDTEEIDFGATFSVSDIEDITKKKDSHSKQVTFKGTKRNNIAFGNAFHLNKHTDFSLANKIGFNLNPLRQVDCIVFEESSVIMRGKMRLKGVQVGKNGQPLYHTVITGLQLEFAQLMGDKKLSDLDLTDLKHTYDWTRIKDSWDYQTQRFDGTTYSNTPFALGSGYVYPFADHGETFRKSDYNLNRHRPYVHVNNFRPAVYVREYIDRIFAQFPGFSYELSGEPALEAKFNSLYVPNDQEKMSDKNSLKNFLIKKTTSTEHFEADSNTGYNGDTEAQFPINFHTGLSGTASDNLINYLGTYWGSTQAVFQCERTFTCDGTLTVRLDNIVNDHLVGTRINIEVCERDYVDPANADFQSRDTFAIIASKELYVSAGQTIASKTLVLDIGEHTYKANSQIIFRIHVDKTQLAAMLGSGVEMDMVSAEMSFPKNQATGTINYEVIYGDKVTPHAPDNVKQVDFLKGILNLFNMYVYTERTRPRHFIFTPHDTFYALTQPSVMLKPSANPVSINWTRKLDLSQGYWVKSNVDLPKKYLFTYKSDDDFVNKDYQDSFDKQVYGQMDFTDSYGLVDQKKVELVFSASPAFEWVGSGRLHGAFFKIEDGSVKPTKTNVRVLFYNGMKTCQAYTVAKDAIVSGKWDKADLQANIDSYACGMEFYYNPGITNLQPVDSLHFSPATCRRFYFGNTFTFENTKGVYANRYMGQVTGLTRGDVVFIECNMFLDEVDIANLDFRTPVKIDLGPASEGGSAFFKVISVDYSQKRSSSKVLLQKIVP